jgi:hypothetical protein
MLSCQFVQPQTGQENGIYFACSCYTVNIEQQLPRILLRKLIGVVISNDIIQLPLLLVERIWIEAVLDLLVSRRLSLHFVHPLVFNIIAAEVVPVSIKWSSRQERHGTSRPACQTHGEDYGTHCGPAEYW